MNGIEAIRAAAEQIRAILGDDDDQQAFLDTLDGETDAMGMIGRLIVARTEARAMAAAAKEVVDTFMARKRRMEAKEEACEAGLGAILDAIGESKVPHELGTVTRTRPRFSLDVTDPAEIPSQLCKLVPDNAAIKVQLEAGVDVPGATLKPGEPGVSIRVK